MSCIHKGCIYHASKILNERAFQVIFRCFISPLMISFTSKHTKLLQLEKKNIFMTNKLLMTLVHNLRLSHPQQPTVVAVIEMYCRRLWIHPINNMRNGMMKSGEITTEWQHASMSKEKNPIVILLIFHKTDEKDCCYHS